MAWVVSWKGNVSCCRATTCFWPLPVLMPLEAIARLSDMLHLMTRAASVVDDNEQWLSGQHLQQHL